MKPAGGGTPGALDVVAMPTLKRFRIALVWLGAAAALVGCRMFPRRIPPTGPDIAPFLAAMSEVDRAGFGFSPVGTNATVRLELGSKGKAYDVMLHIADGSSRTIAFRRTASGYRWIAEQEIFQGPRWRQTVDGNFRETVTLEYQLELLNGVPTNRIVVRADSDDPRLAGGALALTDVRPVLKAWEAKPVEPEPPLLPGAGFNPFLFLIMLAALAAAFLVVGIGLAALAATALVTLLALGVGLVSTAAMTACLHRSASAGFRSLVLQLGVLLGGAAGAPATALLIWLTDARWEIGWRWAAGVTLGCLAGLAMAAQVNRLGAWALRAVSRQVSPGRRSTVGRAAG